MNEHTAELISQLAAKLGTTSEYLWMVLIKQAPISSAIWLIEYVVVACIIAASYRFREQLGGFMRAWFERDEVTASVSCLIFTVISIVILMCCLFGISSTITGFVNPEYWALNEILSAVKSK